MKLIVGLGNPGQQYQNTRHNLGFRVIDELARRWQIEVNRRRFSGLLGSGRSDDQPVLLLKPLTYMNLSGRCVREAMTFHKLGSPDLLVIVDDLALPLGRLRIRPKGSAGGHNGLASIIAELGDDGFARLRLGIDWVAGRDAVRHVLSSFSPQEQEVIKELIPRAADAAACWATGGIETAMNRFNRPDERSDE